jgi:hypothetical protein
MNIFKNIYKKYLQKKFGLEVDIDTVYKDIYDKVISIAKQHYPKYKRFEDYILDEIYWNEDTTLYNICRETRKYVRNKYPKLHRHLVKRSWSGKFRWYRGYFSFINELNLKF